MRVPRASAAFVEHATFYDVYDIAGDEAHQQKDQDGQYEEGGDDKE